MKCVRQLRLEQEENGDDFFLIIFNTDSNSNSNSNGEVEEGEMMEIDKDVQAIINNQTTNRKRRGHNRQLHQGRQKKQINNDRFRGGDACLLTIVEQSHGKNIHILIFILIRILIHIFIYILIRVLVYVYRRRNR